MIEFIILIFKIICLVSKKVFDWKSNIFIAFKNYLFLFTSTNWNIYRNSHIIEWGFLKATLPCLFLNSFHFPSCRAVRSYRPYFEVRDPIWGDDRSNSLYRLSPNLYFPEFSSAVRWIPWYLCTDPSIISLSTLSLAVRRYWLHTLVEWPLARYPDWS